MVSLRAKTNRYMQYTVHEENYYLELDWVGYDKLIFITAHRRENLGGAYASHV